MPQRVQPPPANRPDATASCDPPPKKTILTGAYRTKPEPNLRVQALDQTGDVQFGLRVLRVHLLERLEQDPGDCPVAVVLVVCRDDVPRGPGRGAAGNGRAVCALVLVPVSPLVDVVLAELPPLVGVGQPLEQAPTLLVVGDEETELDDLGLASNQLSLELVDQSISPLDHFWLGQLMDAGDQDVLVMRAIEDSDLARNRQVLADAPQEAVPLLLGSRSFEGGDRNPLRVEVADDVGDGPVLPAGVHALKHYQHRSLVLRVEAFLKFEQCLLVLLLVLERALGSLQSGRRVWVPVRHADGAVVRFGAQQVPKLLLSHEGECKF